MNRSCLSRPPRGALIVLVLPALNGPLMPRRVAAQSAAVDDYLALIDAKCDDPWWFYRFGPSPDRLPELLVAMRLEFAR